jgi:hypothetical protein
MENKWAWHEKGNGWVGTWRGLAILVEIPLLKGPPSFTPQAYIEGGALDRPVDPRIIVMSPDEE